MARKQRYAGCVFLTVRAWHTSNYSAVGFYEKKSICKIDSCCTNGCLANVQNNLADRIIPPTPPGWGVSVLYLCFTLRPAIFNSATHWWPLVQGVLLTLCLRSASVLSFGRGDKTAESGDVDYEYHNIIKGLYATCSSWHIDPCRFPWSDIYCKPNSVLMTRE